MELYVRFPMCTPSLPVINTENLPKTTGNSFIFGRPFVKRFAECYRTVVFMSVNVMLVYCGQTVGWIKMPLGTEVGLGAGHIVLHRDPSPLQKRGTTPIFGPCLLWPNGCLCQLLLSTCPLFHTVIILPAD